MKQEMEIILGAAIILAMIAVYFMPAYIGFRKRNGGAILFLNLFFGWTVVGWIAAFIWACVSTREAKC